MFSGASPKESNDRSTALPQPILGLSTKIHAIAISRPGMAKERSASV